MLGIVYTDKCYFEYLNYVIREVTKMKRFMIATIVALFTGIAFSTAMAGDTLFISSMKANLYGGPDSSSAKVGVLPMGTVVQTVSQEGSWVNVTANGQKGWVQKLFTSKTKPGGKVSLLGSAGANARVHARERASSEVTAASARGLVATSKNAQGRMRGENISDAVANAELANVESVNIPENELMQFLKEGGM